MIAPGRYRARGVEAALGMTGTGKEQVAILLRVVEEGGENHGAELTWYGYFTEKTAERTLESLRHLGWTGDDLTDLSGIDANEVSIVVEHEEGQDGKLRARVQWINAPGGGLAMKDRLDGAAAKAFATRMRGMAIASRDKQRAQAGAANGPRPAAQPRPRAAAAGGGDPGFGDDDIPF
jgi:hypothetical protein